MYGSIYFVINSALVGLTHFLSLVTTLRKNVFHRDNGRVSLQVLVKLLTDKPCWW
jgi:CO dehydrogenase/acetyl-CoA synthase epsilon subunit